MKCLGLTILGADMTFFDNMTFFLAIRTIFFRTIGSNMPIVIRVNLRKICGFH